MTITNDFHSIFVRQHTIIISSTEPRCSSWRAAGTMVAPFSPFYYWSPLRHRGRERDQRGRGIHSGVWIFYPGAFVGSLSRLELWSHMMFFFLSGHIRSEFISVNHFKRLLDYDSPRSTNDCIATLIKIQFNPPDAISPPTYTAANPVLLYAPIASDTPDYESNLDVRKLVAFVSIV